jgi:pSer/pThr/pTyr-binding forkhead associated (FHA) protein
MRALPMARLSLIDPVAPQFGIEMKHSPFTIGRRTGNDAVVPVDSASGVSGSHLTLIFEEGQYFALDEKSTYGTTVNGQSLTKGQRFPLPDGAVIGLGPKVKLQIWFSPKP